MLHAMLHGTAVEGRSYVRQRCPKGYEQLARVLLTFTRSLLQNRNA
jgi:hypothetical protein